MDALPVGMDLVGVVFVEESDDWMWSEQTYEIQAIHPKVWDLIAPHARTLLEAGDHAALARLCSDHCECAVEFSPERWSVLMQLTEQRVPELLPIIEQGFSLPADYTGIREAIALDVIEMMGRLALVIGSATIGAVILRRVLTPSMRWARLTELDCTSVCTACTTSWTTSWRRSPSSPLPTWPTSIGSR